VEKELHTPSDHMCFDEFVLPILYLSVYGFDGSWLIYSFSHYIVGPPTFGFDYPFGIFKLFTFKFIPEVNLQGRCLVRLELNILTFSSTPIDKYVPGYVLLHLL
jgi:hypothetical protein